MSEELKLNLQIERGDRAQRLMDDEILKEAFATLEASYIEAWRKTHATDERGREKLFLAVNVIGKVKDHLTRVIDNGKLANAHIKKMIADQERAAGNTININF